MPTLVRSLSKTVSLEMPAINWRKFYILGVFLIATFLFLSLVFYVFQINELTQGSYTIKNYEKEIKTLSDENAKLEMNFAESGFLGDVEQRAEAMNFEKIKGIKYIQVLDSSLASAK